jgi:hypothetical protein
MRFGRFVPYVGALGGPEMESLPVDRPGESRWATVLVSDGRNLLDEISVVFPDHFFCKLASVRERLVEFLIGPDAHFVRAGHVEFPGGGSSDGGSAATPGAVPM